ncbi:MAG: response regulator [Myxococcales bacterium]|nr:response regulator [Myxococcales bacterium]MCB9520768.1 response regulator [Myxococcales bacterium]MCB9533485.1 response regulator [Myxococcales bacterium]
MQSAPLILLAEDDPMSRDMLARRLQRKGFRVTTAQDGAEAVQRVVDERPDIVLMDLAMPGVDGWEAVRWIRRNEHVGGTPVIALTAHEIDGIRGAARAAGFTDFEPKPIDLPRLVEKIRARIGVVL